jgi:hypothetical protein
MNHDYIKEFNLIDQYLLGKLAVDEAEEFENHFIDCSECAEELNVARSFIQDLKGLVVEETLLSGNRLTPTTRWWHFQQLVPVRSWAVAIACCGIIVAGLFAFFAYRRVGQLEAQLRQAQEDASVIREQYQRGLETAAASEKQHQQDKQELGQRLDELSQQLKTGGKINEPSGRQSVAAEVNFPIYALVSVARTQAAPVEIAPPASSSRFALSIPVEDRADFSVYRVTIVNQQGTTVWQRSGFRPDAYHALSLSLGSSFLSPGLYDLKVEGLIRPDQWNTVGSYPFRITRR